MPEERPIAPVGPPAAAQATPSPQDPQLRRCQTQESFFFVLQTSLPLILISICLLFCGLAALAIDARPAQPADTVWLFIQKHVETIQNLTILFLVCGLPLSVAIVIRRNLLELHIVELLSKPTTIRRHSFWDAFPFASLVFFGVVAFTLCDLAASTATRSRPELLAMLGLYLVGAIVTSIVVLYGAHLVNFESRVSDLTGNMTTVGRQITQAQELLARNTQKVTTATEQIEQSRRSMDMLAAAFRLTRTISEIRRGSQAMASADANLVPLSGSLDSMLTELQHLEQVSLHPLLLPGTPAPTEDRDTVAEIGPSLTHLRADMRQQLPHYAYVSAALGRDFEAQCRERDFPGVLLNVSGFAYYVSTIQKIVEALSPWRTQFEFYTLMPESPLRVFQFRNSADIDEWMKFLQCFNSFHTDGQPGIWRRYFCFTRSDDLKDTFPPLTALRRRLEQGNERGVVLTEDDAWKPRIVKEEQVDGFLPQAMAPAEKDGFRRFNQFHGERGTLVWDHPITGQGWVPLRRALFGYHGLREDATVDQAAEKFRFRCVDELLERRIQQMITVESPIEPTAAGERVTRSRKFPFPCDIFAIRDVRDATKPWVFVMGRDTATFRTRRGRDAAGNEADSAHALFALTPVLDLNTLGHATSSAQNRRTVEAVRDSLDAIFLAPESDDHCGIHRFEQLRLDGHA